MSLRQRLHIDRSSAALPFKSRCRCYVSVRGSERPRVADETTWRFETRLAQKVQVARGEQSYLGCMIDECGIRRRWEAIGSKLDERAQRMFAAAEVRTAGRGGLKAAAMITGLARSTINRGRTILMVTAA